MKKVIVRFIFIATLISCMTSSRLLGLKSPKRIETQKIQIGQFKSRALWTPSASESAALLMLPGSGPQGPEEMIPGNLTVNGKNAPLFVQIAAPFIEAGFNVLALGKPGVDFYSKIPEKRIYNPSMLKKLSWQDLLDNAMDGISFLKSQSTVNMDKIYVLGHSEGTQVATDLANLVPLTGLVLLGYSGEDFLTTLKWQLTDRAIDYFVKTDVDSNKDGYVTKYEAAKWPGSFSWDWLPGQEKVSNENVRSASKANPLVKAIISKTIKSHFCSSNGMCDRGPLYEETARFKGPIHVFTGGLDLQTRASEALKLKSVCKRRKKKNCYVEIIPGVQHGFSSPRPPRRHPLLDLTVGPVEPSFQRTLLKLAKQISQSK